MTILFDCAREMPSVEMTGRVVWGLKAKMQGGMAECMVRNGGILV
jgi:hypothetical protein